jgi:hypothetical protein
MNPGDQPLYGYDPEYLQAIGATTEPLGYQTTPRPPGLYSDSAFILPAAGASAFLGGGLGSALGAILAGREKRAKGLLLGGLTGATIGAAVPTVSYLSGASAEGALRATGPLLTATGSAILGSLAAGRENRMAGATIGGALGLASSMAAHYADPRGIKSMRVVRNLSGPEAVIGLATPIAGATIGSIMAGRGRRLQGAALGLLSGGALASAANFANAQFNSYDPIPESALKYVGTLGLGAGLGGGIGALVAGRENRRLGLMLGSLLGASSAAHIGRLFAK